jgi:protein tyrosine phosphatase (PTP) superfamily phosphohydrolase (DUF442 family)
MVVKGVVGIVAFVVLCNVAIFAAHVLLSRSLEPAAPAGSTASEAAARRMPLTNFAVVDEHVWRGAAPGAAGYRALADAGVTTVVDLRAEENIHVDGAALADLGIERVHLPMRDGQAPPPELVQRFLDVVAESDGKVYVHCGAGVGRTGTMAAAYLVQRDGVSGLEAMRRNLAVGPPSLEQLAFAFGLRDGSVRRPPAPVVALSRTLDAPRRFWVNVRNSYE